MSVKRTIHSVSARSTGPRSSRQGWRNGRQIVSLFGGAALIAATACAGATPEPPSKPTVQAAATQAVGAAQAGAGTAVAAASPAAATAVAAASPVAATVQAGAAPAGATVSTIVGTAVGAIPALASPSPSPAAGIPLRIADASLADATPWLSLQNDGDLPVDVGGWRLQVGSASAELPDDTVVQPGAALTLHAGQGVSSEDEVYLGDAGAVLTSMAQPGTPVRLMDGSGRVVTEVTVPRF